MHTQDLPDPKAVMQSVTEEAYEALERLRPDLLVVFGGETAAAVLAQMGIQELFPIGELFAGVVASHRRGAQIDPLAYSAP